VNNSFSDPLTKEEEDELSVFLDKFLPEGEKKGVERAAVRRAETPLPKKKLIAREDTEW